MSGAVVGLPGARGFDRTFDTVSDALAAHAGPEALPLLFPGAILRTARSFVADFGGRTLYAVKCNPDPVVLQLLYEAGVRDFDVASLPELRLARRYLPRARLHFMHPVKAREAIRAAYAEGVRTFVVDTEAELEKVRQETGGEGLLTLVRLAVSGAGARYALGGKFGAAPDLAWRLLRSARAFGRVGVCFHVGSQCMDPGDYTDAVMLAGEVARRSEVPLSVLDVGGGFPARYPDADPPELRRYFAAIREAALRSGLGGVRCWSEPGRALVADGGATLVRVEDRRDGDLHLNDGIFGTLHDAGVPRWRFPVRRLRTSDAATTPFRLFGPSCDAADVLSRRVELPVDTREGDWLEFGQLGAYSTALKSRFNGFEPAPPVLVAEPPLIDRGHAAERRP